MPLFHITARDDWDAAVRDGAYRPPAFGREGFIHCSHAGQVQGVANRIFRGRHDLVLLEIDAARLICPVVEENLEGGVELFPHIYGPLPVGAVTAVHPFPCEADGSFACRMLYNRLSPR